MRRSKIKQITLAVCLALMPISVFAAGLGKLNVNSGLGEPLNAEIELLSLTPEELSSLTASIASEDVYAAQGINRAYIHSNIKVELGKSITGAPILRLRSTVPVDDPFLDMLVQVDWATGRLQREYTVLLDPPGYTPLLEPSTPLQINAPSIPKSAANLPPSSNVNPNASVNEVSKPQVFPATKPQKTTPKAVIKPSASEPIENTESEITTVRGDTLSRIATRMQSEGVSLDQMLMALYENNKSAFIGNNINQLKVGQIIRMPSAEQLAALSAVEASREVKVHASNWKNYRSELAGIVANAPAANTSPEEKQKAAGKIATAEDKAAPVKTAPQDVIKLSSGEKDKLNTSKDTAKAFQEKITALEEETTAREKALQEAQARTDALEKQIQDMQKLLALKSQTMANVQKNAEDSIPSGSNPNVEDQSAQAQVPVTPENDVEAGVLENPESKEAIDSSADQSTEDKAQQMPPQESPSNSAIAEAEAVESDPTFIDNLLSANNSLYLLLAGLLAAFVAILAGGWLYFRNKKKRDLDSFERGILTSGGLRANTVFGNTTGATGNSDTSFLTDFAQSADGSMIDTNDVDPIAEAEVYMAYGRDAQAEEILKDAISKEPTRYELHLKLLEMYAANQNSSAFEAIAGELYTTLGADSPTWARVAEIGVVMEPNNPLYTASTNTVGTETAQKFNASDFAADTASDDLDLDFSSDIDNAKVSTETAEQSAIESSFSSAAVSDEVDAFEFDATQQFKSGVSAEPLQEAVVDLSFEAMAENASSATESVTDSNTMDFDLGDFSFDAPTLEASGIEESDSTISEIEVNADDDRLLTLESVSEELPRFELPEDDANNTELTDIDRQPNIASDDNTIDFNFDLPADNLANANALSDQNLASVDSSFNIDNISLDLDAEDSVVPDEIALPASASAETPAAFDLTDISLDLEDEPSAPFATPFEEVTNNSDALIPDSPDVAIKLDLVNAYIEMDDKEGARELLEEVLKEGGSLQQKQAQTLLATLD